MTRTYYVGFNITNQKLMIVVDCRFIDIPFNVWRDLGQLAGCSISTTTTEVFEFHSNHPKVIAKAEHILNGALFHNKRTHKMYDKKGYVLRYPNGNLAALDLNSGGYPYPVRDIALAWISDNREKMERYLNAGNPENLEIVAVEIKVSFSP